MNKAGAGTFTLSAGTISANTERQRKKTGAVGRNAPGKKKALATRTPPKTCTTDN
ncbi:hypothetical protein [Treponema primitia]|uniref:hypothetical protein n=1 Tax=Treponema primitia TaxID=88058 RepID=UPI00145F89C7|nr:hypothetical protein [Treponema primitia]